MFLRQYQRTKDGKRHAYFALVESLRTERGPRQRIVAHLGELTDDQRRRWHRTAVFHGRHDDGHELPLFLDCQSNQLDMRLVLQSALRASIRPNLLPAAVLSRLDMDGDGLPDNSPDTDGDGLPDNWEVGGFEGGGDDRFVMIPAPSPIVPGTPPTPIYVRFAVTTDALNPDTDGDGLTDFVEVFGLMFIDENSNGILDHPEEWLDFTGDGLPSPGEYPASNVDAGDRLDEHPSANVTNAYGLRHDFDGFVFTDPTNADTDGDGVVDGEDRDPLINPRAFGDNITIITRFEETGDLDLDGLGDGMDMGNDLLKSDGPGVASDFQVIDNPQNLPQLLSLFRNDLRKEGVIPESAIEDLFSADWDGNGLWRLTDVRKWHLIIPDDSATNLPADLWEVEGHKLYAPQSYKRLECQINSNGLVNADNSCTANSGTGHYNDYGSRGIGLAWQDLLLPAVTTNFLPDRRVWTILYSWRMPGFDIDGDGFVGAPNLANTAPRENNEDFASVALTRAAGSPAGTPYELSNQVAFRPTTDDKQPFDDRIATVSEGQLAEAPSELDGRMDPPSGFPALPCGSGAVAMVAFTLVGLVGSRRQRRNSA